MKNISKKISSIFILIASLSIVLVGCGTGADTGGMGGGKTSSSTGTFSK